MAPACAACGLSELLFGLFVALLLFFSWHDVSALQVYDRQALLNIGYCQKSLTKWASEKASHAPPFLSDKPDYLRCTPVSCQRRKHWWRLGKRGGILVRMKALRRSSERNLRLCWSGFSSIRLIQPVFPGLALDQAHLSVAAPPHRPSQ